MIRKLSWAALAVNVAMLGFTTWQVYRNHQMTDELTAANQRSRRANNALPKPCVEGMTLAPGECCYVTVPITIPRAPERTSTY
jgi:cytochrome oxidase assembly protein ShyY1